MRKMFTYFLLAAPLFSNASCLFKQELKAKAQPIGVVLEWTTFQEQNNDKFIVERSLDGKTFQSTGQVTGQGTSFSEKSYRFLDFQADSGKVFYRLKIVDKKGSISVGRTALFKQTYTNSMMVLGFMGQLSTTELQVELDTRFDGQVNVLVKDFKNDVKLSCSEPVFNGVNRLKIDFSKLQAGIYFVQLQSGTETEQLTIDYEPGKNPLWDSNLQVAEEPIETD